jgi:adenylate cyclase class 2
MPLEIEVKFLLTDPAPIRRRLIELGAESKGREFEKNIRFEDRQNSFKRTDRLLRLRQDRQAQLTFKSIEPDRDGQFKVYRELEVGVDDFQTMHQILEAVGFHPVQEYEKWRETLFLEHTEFCFDTLPFGEFLEIEGGRRSIRVFADRLGLNWEHRILDTYLQIFEQLRQRKGLSFPDLTFDNFKTVHVDPTWLVEMLERGK